jgi:hypothetical protein
MFMCAAVLPPLMFTRAATHATTTAEERRGIGQQRAENREQRAESREQRAEWREQRAE